MNENGKQLNFSQQLVSTFSLLTQKYTRNRHQTLELPLYPAKRSPLHGLDDISGRNMANLVSTRNFPRS